MHREAQHLAEADRHLAEATERIARQAQLVEQLASDGHDTTAAQELLDTLHQSRAVMEQHRQQILDELA